MMSEQISFVLVEPQNGGNIGATARAVKNNGFADLRLVRPAELGDEARRFARGSLDVLDRAATFETLAEAVADAQFVVGFTARGRRDLRESVWLDEATPRIVEAAHKGRVALLFGREDRGLTNEELEPCSLLATIPAAIERPVYNVSQAALLVAFALGRVIETETAPRAETDFNDREILSAADHRYVLDEFRKALVLLGYHAHADPGLLDRVVQRTGFHLGRSGLDASDKAMILGILRRLKRKLEDSGGN